MIYPLVLSTGYYPVDKTIIDTALRRSLFITQTGAVAAKTYGKISRNNDPANVIEWEK